MRSGSTHSRPTNAVCELLYSSLQVSQLLSCWASLWVRENSASWALLKKGSLCKLAGSRAWSLTPASWRCLHTWDNWLIINQGHSHVHCSQSKLVAWGQDAMIPMKNSAGRGTGFTSTADRPPPKHNDAASIKRPSGVGHKWSCPHSWNHHSGTVGHTSVSWLHALFNDLTEQQKVRRATSGNQLLSHKHSTECSQP